MSVCEDYDDCENGEDDENCANCDKCYVHPRCPHHVLVDINTNSTQRTLLPLSPIYNNMLEIQNFNTYTRCERNAELISKIGVNVAFIILLSIAIAYAMWILVAMVNL